MHKSPPHLRNIRREKVISQMSQFSARESQVNKWFYIKKTVTWVRCHFSCRDLITPLSHFLEVTLFSPVIESKLLTTMCFFQEVSLFMPKNRVAHRILSEMSLLMPQQSRNLLTGKVTLPPSSACF
uniref:Uncharacterized protein n=1 Tax=Lygus hesperus TaxID=30085 RepID=A0A0A9XZW8_LYGHE